MLVSFSVANYRSFGDEVTLSMVASKRLEDHPSHLVPIPGRDEHLLRTAVIYGANAAGKSNLVRAMQYAQRALISQSVSAPTPFHFDPKFADQPSSFEFRILIGERLYAYGFDVLKSRILGEWLCLLQGDDEPAIFERDFDGKITLGEELAEEFSDDPLMFQRLQELRPIPLRDSQLFLNRLFSLPEESLGKTLNELTNWFQRGLVTRIDYTVQTLERLQTDRALREFYGRFLAAADTGISGLRVREERRPITKREREQYEDLLEKGQQDLWKFALPCSEYIDRRVDPEDPSIVITKSLEAIHDGSGEQSLQFAEESDGTKQFLELLSAISGSATSSSILVIDEFDHSLHPLLCREFLRFFNESSPGSHHQLILTTHEAHLLDEDLLRRDEYWLVEKGTDQQSRLVSLSDFDFSTDLQIRQGYLQGRFGGIPYIGGLDTAEQALHCPHAELTDAPQEAHV